MQQVRNTHWNENTTQASHTRYTNKHCEIYKFNDFFSARKFHENSHP